MLHIKTKITKLDIEIIKMKKDTIVLVRLLSGEELVGKVKDIDEDGYTLEKPCNLIVTPTQGGQAQLMLQPFIQYVEEKEFGIGWNTTVTHGTPIIEIRNQWNQRFGSGIFEPDTSKIHSLTQK